jgi:hypothetical protein
MGAGNWHFHIASFSARMTAMRAKNIQALSRSAALVNRSSIQTQPRVNGKSSTVKPQARSFVGLPIDEDRDDEPPENPGPKFG